MNFSISLYANVTGGISRDSHVSEQAAQVDAAIFLTCYAFGCELWAPWNGEVGRWLIMQLGLFLVNVWQLPAALAELRPPSRLPCLGGLSSAEGPVALAMGRYVGGRHPAVRRGICRLFVGQRFSPRPHRWRFRRGMFQLALVHFRRRVALYDIMMDRRHRHLTEAACSRNLKFLGCLLQVPGLALSCSSCEGMSRDV